MDQDSQDNFRSLEMAILADMLDEGMVDADLLVRLAQIVSQPEFNEFFVVLCRADLSPGSVSSQRIFDCTQDLIGQEKLLAS